MQNPESQKFRGTKFKPQTKIDQNCQNSRNMADHVTHDSTNTPSLDQARQQTGQTVRIDPTIQSCLLDGQRVQIGTALIGNISDNVNKIQLPDENNTTRHNDHKTFMPDPTRVK